MEQMSFWVTPAKADIAPYSQHVSNAPKPEVLADGPERRFTADWIGSIIPCGMVRLVIIGL
jgi:hypothetical protein